MHVSLRLNSFYSFHNASLWTPNLRTLVEASLRVIPEFLLPEEEKSLLEEVEPHMKRLRYEKSHWDNAIHLYREREQKKWLPSNEAVLQRIRYHFGNSAFYYLYIYILIYIYICIFFNILRNESFALDTHHITYVHILDLHKDGVIKPHIDSSRYCGDVITGVSLLSDCVMRLRHKDRKDELVVDLLLPRRSLYRLGEISRYEFTHEVLANNESKFNGRTIVKDRRISIICRDLPKRENILQGQIEMKPIPEI
uniref:2OG-FeII_Oxy_2 domain-containing protein n=1 Tax=Heterorhabditis bacteriophora TaxID=37862 RepID=A0A1I7XC61_HETBA